MYCTSCCSFSWRKLMSMMTGYKIPKPGRSFGKKPYGTPCWLTWPEALVVLYQSLGLRATSGENMAEVLTKTGLTPIGDGSLCAPVLPPAAFPLFVSWDILAFTRAVLHSADRPTAKPSSLHIQEKRLPPGSKLVRGRRCCRMAAPISTCCCARTPTLRCMPLVCLSAAVEVTDLKRTSSRVSKWPGWSMSSLNPACLFTTWRSFCAPASGAGKVKVNWVLDPLR
mmetsp:Transcript_15877/g.41796  ORF Transcript_15877/g.41796 Transcript_15877/m.41796 type:complete len:225 (+) Transcript_15877:467-1141(+)